ncbi:hypothetical protein [Paraburkholderia bannensis]|uniref:hypothetical protein n=1 Tax=Paraburkholderia bannensis TaxID=765414 RepID=UPI002AB08A52|nr:hypothetical protein [Paraburkholderia bannensis]
MLDVDERTDEGDARLRASGNAPSISFDKPSPSAKTQSLRRCETSFSTESAAKRRSCPFALSAIYFTECCSAKSAVLMPAGQLYQA